MVVLGGGGPCPACGRALVRVGRTSRTGLLLVAVPVGAALLAVVALLGVKLRPGIASKPQPATGDIRHDASRKFSPGKYFSDHGAARMVEAALNNDTRAFKQEIAKGARVNARGNSGLTPLHLALLNASPAAFSAILEAGGDPNAAADNGDSVVGLAAMMPDPAYLSGCLKHGAKPDLADARKETPLMLAATRSRRANVRLLLDAGADPNAKDARSLSPLMHAFQALAPDPEIARMMLRAGARTEYANAAGLTARDYAETFEDPSLLEVFPK